MGKSGEKTSGCGKKRGRPRRVPTPAVVSRSSKAEHAEEEQPQRQQRPQTRQGSDRRTKGVKGSTETESGPKSQPRKQVKVKPKQETGKRRRVDTCDEPPPKKSRRTKTATKSSRTPLTKMDQPQTTTTANEDNYCVICMSDITEKRTLPICQHIFCRPCIDAWFEKTNPVCPSCGLVYGEITGNQPDGQMYENKLAISLPGYENCNCIEIGYYFPNGTQSAKHPNPGQPFSGTHRIAYLPDNPAGQRVLRLLRVAFRRRLIFTVGRSVTTGRENTVVWNDIHHKTSTHGGSTSFGYPDPTYLNRVEQELAAQGVTE